jgi:anti-sigma factor RsiW
MAASLAAVLILGYSWGSARARNGLLLDEAVADHVRSLQAGHLMDVVSTDQHTVKPWFNGRLDFSPPVADLADLGFPLAGGRLERLDGQTAAALVFHRRLHSINLFVWSAARGSVPEGLGGKSGYQVKSWSQGGLNFLAVSEIPAAELGQFVESYCGRINPGGPSP